MPTPRMRHRLGLLFASATGCTMLAPMPVVYAQEAAPSAAEIDWRPKSDLPEDVRRSLPDFCEGGYLPSAVPGTVKGGAGEPAAQHGQAPLQASGLNARYELDNELFLRGDVRLQQPGFQVTGSEARYNQATGAVSIEGPLTSRGDGFLLTGERADYDVNSGRVDINTATFLLHGPEMRGSATQLSRTAEDQVRIRGGSLTTCAPDNNDWSIVASDIHLDQGEGVGTAKHVRLEISDIPVFYWPYASFPIDDRRKTGFLYPSFGTSNAGSGAFLSVPYYLNLAPHYDATLTPQYIHGRGLFTEAEGRYLSSLGESVLQLGYAGNDTEYEEEFPSQGGERWGLDFSTQARFGYGWTGYGDYSVVSDDDYLSDLNRNLEINRATHLRRRGGIRYRDSSQYFETYLNGYQTLKIGRAHV